MERTIKVLTYVLEINARRGVATGTDSMDVELILTEENARHTLTVIEEALSKAE